MESDQSMKPLFPLHAIVGQDQLVQALVLVAIEPAIGGVLISGPRGTAKSTAVRAMSQLLPENNLVDVPLGATEEMITGSLDLQTALDQSELHFQPGLLAKAHQGILYVDEVNLLPDHLVDLLLDAAASGENIVERDHVSHRHQTDFSLIGTMNPDEGELRPQLLDRFGLFVQVNDQFSLQQRMSIVQSRLQFEASPDAFVQEFNQKLAEFRQTLEFAQTHRGNVAVDESIHRCIAQKCADANVDGLRADIVMYRAGIAHALINHRHQVQQNDIEAVADLVLNHRTKQAKAPSNPPQNGNNNQGNESSTNGNNEKNQSSIQGAWGTGPKVNTQTIQTPAVIQLNEANNKTPDTTKKLKSNPGAQHGIKDSGRFVQPRFGNNKTAHRKKVHWPSTLLNLTRLKPSQRSIDLLSYRYAQPASRFLDVILLDTSASTLSGKGLGYAKGAIQSLCEQGYLQRRYFCLMTFGNQTVKTVLYPQRTPKDIGPALDKIEAGGGTPIAQALDTVRNRIRLETKQFSVSSLYLITDGRWSQSAQHHPLFQETCCTVIDIESGKVRLKQAEKLARDIQAQYCHITSLS